nr:tRNA lysidine(34) synthetase TilS [uncultured Sphingomonas sp.]
MTTAADAVRRFADALDALVPAGERVGVAVSGGPDSLALLLLAAAARPNLVEAVTVDHGLRPESAAEAAMVAQVCAERGITHTVLRADWTDIPAANIQAEARAMRYRLLHRWARERALGAIATAHHADDQAETTLMRLARGSGLTGLAGIRRMRNADGLRIVRPLLDWRKAELVDIARHAGLAPVDDPSNRDDRYARTRARALLADQDWLMPERLAASASALADSEEAMQWMVAGLAAERLIIEGNAILFDPADLPRDIVRRLLLTAFGQLDAVVPRGPDLERAINALTADRPANLSGLLLRPGARWVIAPEPPRTA